MVVILKYVLSVLIVFAFGFHFFSFFISVNLRILSKIDKGRRVVCQQIVSGEMTMVHPLLLGVMQLVIRGRFMEGGKVVLLPAVIKIVTRNLTKTLVG